MNDTSEKLTNASDHVYLKSMFYEQLVEHVFVSEILQEVWYFFGKTAEVLRSEVDASGYDVVIECNECLRHIQLKTSKADAKASGQKVNIALADKKKSGCIVWIVRHEDQTCRMRLSYRFFGGEPGQPLPSLDDEDIFKVAKHSKANAQGVKLERPAIRVIPKSKFTEIQTTRELVGCLFGLRERANVSAIEQIEEVSAESDAEDF